jgi:pyridoxal 5'-phosphate synthase pdxS subunit
MNAHTTLTELDAAIIAEVSKHLGEAMVGIEISKLPQDQLLANRGW